jgi:hypothetical protein
MGPLLYRLICTNCAKYASPVNCAAFEERAPCRSLARSCAWPFRRQGHADLQPVDRCRLGQGIGGIGDARCASHLRARQLQGRPDRRTRGDTGSQRRRLADAALLRAARSRPSRTGPATPQRSTRATSRRNPTGAPSSAVCGWRGDFRRPCAAAVRLKPPAIAEAGYGARVRDLRLLRRVSMALITPPNSEFPILECAETHVVVGDQNEARRPGMRGNP